jgi:uncharacterized protein YkwD
MISGIRFTTAVLASSALGVALWVAPAEAAATTTPRATTYAADAFRATNDQRVHHDRVRLKKTACLTRVAARWARHMARTGSLTHQRLGPIMSRCHVSWVGENIAVGFVSGRAVVNRGWMRSSGHRANILRRQYRLMGIGAARDGHGRWWTSQVFGRR